MLTQVFSKIENVTSKQFLLVSIILSFVIYGNTLFHKYALDDAIVITKNEFTKQGFSGIKDIFSTESFTGFFGKKKELVIGGRYRPFSIATFAVEYEFFGLNPFGGHLVNIVLYGLLVWLMFLVLSNLLKERLGKYKVLVVGFLSAVLFLIHPIHTEVVANIKGRDEILSLLFSLLAFYVLLKSDLKIILQAVIAGVCLFLALLSKENAIAFVFIVPVSFWYFKNVKPKKVLLNFLILLVPAIIFLMIRNKVLGGFNTTASTELMNNPFLGLEAGEKFATILYTWFIYIKLLIFPHPLTYDYYPFHIPVVDFSNGLVIVSLIFVVGLMVSFMYGLKRRTIISFSILAFAASFILMSNLLFSVGTFMNERFVFVSSMFWCLALVYSGYYYWNNKTKLKPLIIGVGIYLLAFYPLKSISRNSVWKDDLTLFTTDVKTSVNSAKSNCSAGGKLWEEGKVIKNEKKQKEYYKLSEIYLRKAVEIHPKYIDAWILLGNLLYDSKKEIDESAYCFMKVLSRQPNHTNARNNIDIVLQNTKNRQLQLKYYNQLYKLDSIDFKCNYRLGVIYGRYLGDLTTGVKYLEKAVAIDNTNSGALKDLGTAYGMNGQIEKAYQIFKHSVTIDSTDAQMFNNLAVSCMQLGKKEEASKYFAKVKEMKK